MDEDVQSKLAHEFAMLTIPVAGSRRPLLFGNVLRAGLRVALPNAHPDEHSDLRSTVIGMLVELHATVHASEARQEVRALQEQVSVLKDRIAAQGLFTERTMQKIRIYHRYGMSVSALATLYGCDRARIRRVLGKHDVPAVTETRDTATTVKRTMGI